MNMGFTPGMGTTRLLQLAVGEYVASEMMYGGQFFKGAHFESSAGVNYVLPRDQVFPKALELAQRIAEKPRMALTLLKRALLQPRRQALEEALTEESRMHRLCFDRPETARMIQEYYLGEDGEREE
jgi:polyketide biosynthesis enoyl-CoA hydratase PksI